METRKLNNKMSKKINNLIIYLAENINQEKEPFDLIKAIKLLYLIDEFSVKETGVPITFLNYQAWKAGPVANELYDEVKSKKRFGLRLRDYFKFKEVPNTNDPNSTEPTILVIPKCNFDNGEFSKHDMTIINKVLEDHRDKSKNELINLLHKNGSLWKKVVKKNNLRSRFNDNPRPSIDIDINGLLNKNNWFNSMAYETAIEAINFEIKTNGASY